MLDPIIPFLIVSGGLFYLGNKEKPEEIEEEAKKQDRMPRLSEALISQFVVYKDVAGADGTYRSVEKQRYFNDEAREGLIASLDQWSLVKIGIDKRPGPLLYKLVPYSHEHKYNAAQSIEAARERGHHTYASVTCILLDRSDIDKLILFIPAKSGEKIAQKAGVWALLDEATNYGNSEAPKIEIQEETPAELIQAVNDAIKDPTKLPSDLESAAQEIAIAYPEQAQKLANRAKQLRAMAMLAPKSEAFPAKVSETEEEEPAEDKAMLDSSYEDPGANGAVEEEHLQ